ncbi:MAG: hypothetical protein R3293_27345 [Candidatus Promineifilaceae bacterium]|nr:hypothetical protein [Candidatus Promineifilaceae bacterium]
MIELLTTCDASAQPAAGQGQNDSDALFALPVYLDPDVEEYLNKLAAEKDINVQ